MELDDYISKYIDSELTDEEDVELRKMLSEDDFAREKFDSAVTVHLAMKEDSQSIEPPEDIFRQTEDIVLMKILASQPIVAERPFFRWRTQVLAAMIVFFILSFIFQIDDLKLNRNVVSGSEPATTLSNTQENSGGQNLIATTDRLNNNRTRVSLGRATNSDVLAASVSTTGGGAGARANDESSAISDDNASSGEVSIPAPALKPTAPMLDKFIAEEKIDLLMPNNKPDNTNTGIIVNEKMVKDGSRAESISMNGPVYNKAKTDLKNVNIISEPLEIKPSESKTDIIFSSFLGTDFVRTGIDDKQKLAVTNFSQSIAYTINGYEKMGIEIGYSEYAYKENVILPSPYQSIGSENKPIVESSELVIPVGGNYYETQVTFNKQRHMVWGSAFYERSLLKSETLSLEGRIGFGLSHDGPLGYGRLFGMYEFLKGFSLTIGAEGRLFQATLPGEQQQGKMKSAATVIYGFQVNF